MLAASAIARECTLDLAVALDMGGTTVKVCLIENGRPRETPQMEVSLDAAGRLARGSGHALLSSGFDLVEIGAGGGSIAWLDDGGALRVGPESAGAKPGPACYDLGGNRPTITDAAVVLGYLNPAAIAGGTVPIRFELAQRVISDQIAEPTGMTSRQAAYGICRVAVASMRRAVRMVTIQRGCDPRQCTLIAFGGAAPLLAASLADELEIGSVYVPPHAGLFSAQGLLTAEMRFDSTASFAGDLAALDGRVLLAKYDAMLVDARAELAGSGVAVTSADAERSIDLRYIRQGSELTIPLPDAEPGKLAELLVESFHQEHRRQFGYQRLDSVILTSTLRLRILIKDQGRQLANVGGGSGELDDETMFGCRRAYFGDAVGTVEAPVWARRALAARGIIGPAIVEEFDTTIVVPPGWGATLDARNSVVLERVENRTQER